MGVHVTKGTLIQLRQFNVSNAQACMKTTLGKVAYHGVPWRSLQKCWKGFGSLQLSPVHLSDTITGLKHQFFSSFGGRQRTPPDATFPRVLFLHAWALKTLNWLNFFTIFYGKCTPLERHWFGPSVIMGSDLAPWTPYFGYIVTKLVRRRRFADLLGRNNFFEFHFFTLLHPYAYCQVINPPRTSKGSLTIVFP